MTETVKTETLTAPSPAQMESWRRLWNLLLESHSPAPEVEPETDTQANYSGQVEECSTP